MKKFLILCACIVGIVSTHAQTVIDNFTVGPYVVDYNGQGDVKYRLRDNINLYEFFELQKDTTIIALESSTPILHAVQISGNVGSTRFLPKEIGIECVWKQKLSNTAYFNGGVSLGFGISNLNKTGEKRDVIEIGIPLQIEIGQLSRQKSSLYGIFGLSPKFYSTITSKNWTGETYVNGKKKSGILIAPALEFGGNIPLENSIFRIGVYGTYKINCSTSDVDIYKNMLGHMYLGARIGIVI